VEVLIVAGKLIRLFLVDGDSDGIKTLEISNMTIYATCFPRSMFGNFKKRIEAEKPGVYLLYGVDYKTNDMNLYIGEGDPILDRINSHYKNSGKDFWNNAIVFTSKDGYLTKTQIQYIEAKLIVLAKKCDRVKLDNANIPNEPNISEVDISEVEVFLENILLLMETMGFDYFAPITSNSTSGTQENIYVMTYKKASAQMVIENGKYILLKGSTLIREEAQAAKGPLRVFRKKLLDNNIISLSETDDQILIVNESIEFDSASSAASVVAGIGVNGLINWKLNGSTIKEIEKQQAQIVVTED
jgi:hypothetical protein